jgi:hypothetical protein
MPLEPALPPLPDTLPSTRIGLQQVAVHVLARRRHGVTGRFGLRPSPGGFATPAFTVDAAPDPEVEVLRTSGDLLVIERGATTRTVPLATLGAAAADAGVDLAAAFSVGGDTPAVADPDAPLAIDGAAARLIGEWYAFGAIAIDELVATTPAITASTTLQIWPEHFDLGGTVTLAGDVGVTVGASPGDGGEPLPYVYVSPWGEDRPGDPGYWNAGFGAVLRAEELVGLPADTARASAVAFLRQGIDLLAAG